MSAVDKGEPTHTETARVAVKCAGQEEGKRVIHFSRSPLPVEMHACVSSELRESRPRGRAHTLSSKSGVGIEGVICDVKHDVKIQKDGLPIPLLGQSLTA